MGYAGIVGLNKPSDYSDWTAYGNALHNSLQAWGRAAGIHLDEFDDGTDDAKLTSAIAAQQAATDRNMPPIVLPCRPMTMTTPRQMYSGVKVIGAGEHSYQKNPDISGGNRSGPEITLAGSIGSGTSSMWRSPGADVNNPVFANFQVQGNGGSSVHQFIDYTAGSMYPASFHSLGFNMMRGVFGRSDRKCLMTQATFTGDWTINNCWDTPLFPGGSDINFMPSMMNIGVTSSAVQTGDVNRFFMKIDSTEISVGGKVYISTMNGWRGVLISGSSNVDWHGGVVEGFKPTRQISANNPAPGHLSGPGPGVQFKITGGTVTFYGTKIGQGMDNPDASEGGLVDMSGGNVTMFGPNFYGANLGSINAIRQTGGRLRVYGATHRGGHGIPRLASNALIYNGKLTQALSGPPAYAIGDQAPDSHMYDEAVSFCFVNDYSLRKVA